MSQFIEKEPKKSVKTFWLGNAKILNFRDETTVEIEVMRRAHTHVGHTHWVNCQILFLF
jgi:hypothetical protein